MRFRLSRLIELFLCVGLSSCVAYRPEPLPSSPGLQSSLAALRRQLPDGGTVSVSGPMSLQDVARLAVLNDPDLTAARAQHGVAQAELLAAGLPPDPSISGGFEALLGGPGTMSAISGSLTQDISALVTYVPDKQAAKAGLAQEDAGILWQEWQVAAQAEQLCVTLDGDRAMLASLRADQMALERVNGAVQTQMTAGNLTQADASASATALATVQGALDTAEQTYAQDRDQLDALLGVMPGVEISLASPTLAPVPADVAQRALVTLSDRRPDLIALRYGYTQAEQKLRAAIWSQFLPISLGAAGGRDTTGVVSAGPQVTLTLPLFNHNHSAIVAAEATRTVLRAQYDASLVSATSGVEALEQNMTLLRGQSQAADEAAARAQTAAASARQAFTAGALDARAETDLITTAGEREREAIALHTKLQTAELSLATLLGLGLPPIASQEPAP
jgi:outer membrane protein TolC